MHFFSSYVQSMTELFFGLGEAVSSSLGLIHRPELDEAQARALPNDSCKENTVCTDKEVRKEASFGTFLQENLTVTTVASVPRKTNGVGRLEAIQMAAKFPKFLVSALWIKGGKVEFVGGWGYIRHREEG